MMDGVVLRSLRYLLICVVGVVVIFASALLLKRPRALACVGRLAPTPGRGGTSQTVNRPKNGGTMREAPSEETQRLMAREAELISGIAALKKALAKDATKLNPYTRRYVDVKKRHNKFWKRVSELQARLESSTGDERMRCSDELRKMKGEDIRLAQDLAAAGKLFKEWQRKNVERISHPRITAAQNELAMVRRRLESRY